MARAGQFKRWVWTSWLKHDDAVNSKENLYVPPLCVGMRFMCGAPETSADGDWHLQGGLLITCEQYRCRKRGANDYVMEGRFFRNFPEWIGIHIEPAWSDDARCIEYAKGPFEGKGPDGAHKVKPVNPDYFEWGAYNKRGRAKGPLVLDDMVDMIMDGQFDEAVSMYPAKYVMAHRGLETLASRVMPHRSAPPEVNIVWGATGSGKDESCQAYANAFYNGSIYWKAASYGKWWPGYAQQKVCVLDEWTPSDERGDLHYLLTLLDWKPFWIEVKGGFVKFNSPVIFITSNYNPRSWFGAYPNVESERAFKRRIRCCIYRTGRQIYSGVPQLIERPLKEFEDDCHYMD